MKSFFLSFLALAGICNTTQAQNFTQVTGGIALNSFTSWGISWQDVDGDNDLDLFVNDKDQHRLFRNDGSGVFTAVTPSALASPAPLGFYYSTAWGDYNNDGFLDLYMGNDGDKNALFKGAAGGTFTQVTTGIQSSERFHSFGNVSFVDYDKDGFLDIFCSNVKNAQGNTEKNTLYKGDGTAFTKITTGAPVNDLEDNWCHAWADFNNDRCPDLFVGNMSNDFLYKNNCDGTFTKVTTGPVVSDGKDTETASWGDWDNDGFLDLFVGIWGDKCRLYRNNGDGTFSLKSGTPLDNNIDNVTGSGWADMDNDGDLDLYVCCWTQSGGVKNRFYRNDGSGNFSEILGNTVNNNPHASNTCLWADADGDGDMDLYIANKATANEYFRNDGNANTWAAFKLTGSNSNHSSIGAKVRVKATIGGTAVWQMREIGGTSGQFAQAPLIANFGLGGATVIDSVIVEWPAGSNCVYTQVPVGKAYAITESGCTRTALGITNPAGGPTAAAGAPYPMPFATAAHIPYTLTAGGEVTLTVFDITGRKFLEVPTGYQSAGAHEVFITNEKFPAAGTYLYHLKAGAEMLSGKIVFAGQ